MTITAEERLMYQEHSYEKFRFAGDVDKLPFADVYRAVKKYIKAVLPRGRNMDCER